MYMSQSTQMVNAQKCKKKISLAYHGTLTENGSVFHLIKVYCDK